ncbi:hypothetical protein ACFL1H_01725, partial [Nanoarchaeota archaeon]
SENEYKKILNLERKDLDCYRTALNQLSIIQYIKRNEKDGKTYKDAYDFVWQRYQAGDINLTKNGVNDFLIEKGINIATL